MTPEIITCPYCNASLQVQTDWSAGQRILCPRCGDAFPFRPIDTFTDRPSSLPSQTAITSNLPDAVPPAPIREGPVPARASNRLIAGIVLGVMLLMAGSGLTFMLLTQEQRRSYDTSRPPRRPGRQRGVPEPENIPPVANIAPDKLAALSYLPSDVNFLFAARIPELLATPVGTQLLRDPISVGEWQLRLESLPKWLGFRLEEVDHLVLGARITDALLPPFSLVFRTSQPYDEAQLRQRLQCTRIAHPGKKALYMFRVPRQAVPLNAWFADDHTVVLSLFADHLAALPFPPVADLQQLPQELRALLKERREPAAPVWIAGHSRDWSKTSAALFLNRRKKEELANLKSIRTFGVWFVPEKALQIKGIFACENESKARGLEDYFRSLRGDDAAFKTALDGPWLTLQFQASPDFLTHVLKR